MRCVCTKMLPLLIASLIPWAANAQSASNATVRMNQIAFYPKESKQAVIISGTTDPVVVKNQAGTVVFTDTLGAASTWAPSGESVRLADFSGLTTPGTYTLTQGLTQIGRAFTISDTALQSVLKGGIKFYYFQRASTALASTNAGTYARSAGHMDGSVSKSYIGSGTISSPKGWYDAGDYGKYIVNSGISTYTLLALYEHYAPLFDTLQWNIPESSNARADLLDEIKWNLDWMLTMQDAADGGVYHKLTTAVFSDAVMPSADVATRYVFMKTTTATFDFAAVMAVASRLYASSDATFAATCKAAAIAAYTWGKNNATTYYTQPAGVNTGEYGDSYAVDEHFWAATELYLATQTASYLNDIHSFKTAGGIPDWGNVGMLAYLTMAMHPSVFATDAPSAKDTVYRVANTLRANTKAGGYGVPILSGDFVWGSNAVVANQGMILMHAYYLSKDTSYLSAAAQAEDYLLGRNPKDMSYLSGFGAKSPQNPHHRPSQADGISAPVPGMLAGGPHNGGNDVGTETWECTNYVISGKPALSYYDNTCSYATNEVAINWNAPFSYLTGALQGIYTGVPVLGVNLTPPATPVLMMPHSMASINSGVHMRWDGHSVRVVVPAHNGLPIREFSVDGHEIK